MSNEYQLEIESFLQDIEYSETLLAEIYEKNLTEISELNKIGESLKLINKNLKRSTSSKSTLQLVTSKKRKQKRINIL